ncbi:MAG: ester cyclase [Candidatus Aminicenantales bacterium]
MKKCLCIVPLVLLLCFTIACQDKAAMAELEKFKAQATVEQQNEALVRSAFDRLSKGDEAVYQEMYAPEYGWYFPTLNPKALTREEEAGFVKLLRAGFPDIRWDINDMVASGDRVVARFVVSGTHTGEYQGLLPTGIKVRAGGLWMARIKNGKFIEVREETDLLGFMQQLGMELKPKEETKK